MRFLYMLILALLGLQPAVAQSIRGQVSDAATGEALPYSTIGVAGTATGATADAQGRFSLELPVQHGKLIISAIGYRTDTLELRPGKNHYMARLQSSDNSLSEVVVSGTLREMSRLESPIPVAVYSPALFKKNPSPTLFESLNMISGLQPQLNCNVCNTGDIHINGLEGPYTMILIDGMPIVSSLSTVYGLHGIPQSMVKRIEVVKGPGSTLYGSEAVAGVINVITQDPGSAPRLQADLNLSSLGELSADASAAWKAGKASSLLGLSYFNYNRPIDINDDNFTDLTLQHRASVFNKWSFQRSSGKAASIAIRAVREERWGGEMQWEPRWRGTDSIYGEAVMTNRLELIGTYGLPVTGQNIRLDYSYNYHHQDSWYGTTEFFARQHTAFAQLVWDKQIGDHSLLAGLPLRYTAYDDNTPATADRQGFNKPANTFLPGAFVQSELKLAPKFTTLAGLRYDHHSLHGAIVTPRLSFKYAPNASHTIRLTGGSGYRVVNLFTEDHAALTGSRQVVIKNELMPERSWNGNLNYAGIIRHSKGFINLDASVFYTYFSNQIVGDFLSHPDQIIYDNLQGHAVSKGINASVDLFFTSGLKLLTGITLMDVYRKNRQPDGSLLQTPQLFAPRFSANYALSYRFGRSGLTADWTGRINGPMQLPVQPHDFRPERSPLYCIMNLQLSQQLGQGVEIYGGAKNLLNFVPEHPLMRPFDPFDKHAADAATNPNGYTFDTSYNYAPIQGIKGFLGIRWTMR